MNTVASLDRVRIVLVETSHTGNMGSAARAMKTMGLSQLYLVNPIVKPDSQAISLAAGASDLIKHATITATLDEAIAGCRLVVGTSARSRTLPWPMLNPRSCGEKMVDETQSGEVALVFGRERVGLTNEELQKCHYHVAIPANPDYSSLNLAMSVQVLAYEIRMAMLALSAAEAAPAASTLDYPPAEDTERFYQHLEQTLIETDFINPTHPGQIMSRLRRLFARARPEVQELNILRGILTSIDKKTKR
ncbi:tRNA (cytosine(32)/uridine(32)-2'-O)-methyltransferase TrmJ [Utexia brackfieldae]|uniref:tRNA (cytosine(32)/uridine(32)-2'-O)-methyltransferase TrmJ n=1 Tax=Utexia brackfieldae TaxID=3074108 RepID=UPI00370D0911